MSSLLFVLGAVPALWSQSASVVRSTTTAVVQPRWTALTGHNIYLLSTTATSVNGRTITAVFASTNRGLYRSLDSGRSWISQGLPNDDVYDVVLLPTATLAATDGGLQRQVQSASVWQRVSYPVASPASPSTNASAQATAATVRLQTLPTYSLVQVGSAVFAGTSQGVYRSTDGGATWSTTGTTLARKTVRTVIAVGTGVSSTLYAAVWNDGIYRSTDNGMSWVFADIVPGSTVERTFRTLAVFGSTVYAGSSQGNLYQTVSGTNWTKVVDAGNDGSVNPRGFEAMTRYGNTIIGAVYNGLVYSFDNGRTWQHQRVATQNISTLIAFAPQPRSSSSMSSVNKGGAEITSSASPCPSGSVRVPGSNSETCGGGGGGSDGVVITGSGTFTGVSIYLPVAPDCLHGTMIINTMTPTSTVQQQQQLTVALTFHTITTMIPSNRNDLQTRISVESVWIAPIGSSPRDAVWERLSFISNSYTIPATIANRPGEYDIRAVYIWDNGCGYGREITPSVNFTVTAPIPQASFAAAMTPSTLYVGNSPQTLTLSITNFRAGQTNGSNTVITVGGQPATLLSPIPQGVTTTPQTVLVSYMPSVPGQITVTANNPGASTPTPAQTSFQVLPIPPPSISSLSPSTAQDGSTGAQGLTLTVNGSNFMDNATLSFGGTPLNITGRSGMNQLTATVPQNLLVRNNLDPVQIPVLVSNPGVGQQPAQTASRDFTLTPAPAPMPIVNNITPTSITHGAQASPPITLTGTGFTTRSVVELLIGSQVVATQTNGGLTANTTGTMSMQVVLNSPLPQPGAYTLRVSNTATASGGGGTAMQNFTIGYPTPTLQAPTPNSLVAGTILPGQTLQLQFQGTNLYANTSVLVVSRSGVPTQRITISGISQGQFSASVNGEFFQTPGTVQFQLENPAVGTVPAQTSAAQILTVTNPQPILNNITPERIVVDTTLTTITLSGSKFMAGATVWRGVNGGTPVQVPPNLVTLVNESTIHVNIAGIPGLLSSEAAHSFWVENIAGGGRSTNSKELLVLQPLPRLLTGVPGAAVVRSSAPFTVTLTGSGFTAGTQFSMVNITNTSSPIPNAFTVRNRTATSVELQLQSVVLNTAGRYSIVASNPALSYGQPLGGGTAPNPVAFDVTFPQPVLNSITPDTAITNITALRTITGTGLFAETVITLTKPDSTSVSLSPASVVSNGSSMSVNFQAQHLDKPGVYTLRLTNPFPGGGLSVNTRTITVVNPRPALTSVAGQLTVGASVSQLTLLGSGFIPGMQVFLLRDGVALAVPDSVVTVQGTAQATVMLPASLLTRAGVGRDSVTVQNPTPGGGRAAQALALTVWNPAPFVQTASVQGNQPTSTPSFVRTTQAVDITLTGSGFIPGARVTVNGWTVPSVVPPSGAPAGLQSTMTMTVPSTIASVAGVYTIVVTNPEPQRGASNGVQLTIQNPRPVLTGITPQSLTVSSTAVLVTITGTNFITGATVTIQGVGTLTPQSISPGQLTVLLPPALNGQSVLDAARELRLTVQNSPPTPAPSEPIAFVVLNPAPVLASVLPAQAVITGNALSLTLSGTNFVPRGASAGAPSELLFNGNVVSVSSITPNSITAVIPATALTASGMLTVQVRNPQTGTPPQGGGTSAVLTFPLVNPAPVLTGISPQTATVGDSLLVLTLSGNQANTPFVAAAQVQIRRNDTTLTLPASAVQWLNNTTLTATLPASFLNSADTVFVRVLHPALSVNGTPTGGGSSAERAIVMQNPVPVLSAVQPQQTLIAQSTTLTLSGSRFVPGAVVRFVLGANTTPLATTVLSPTQLTATLPASLITLARTTYSLTVTNPTPGGGTSGALPFTAQNPRVQVDSVSPAILQLNGAATTLTLRGSNIVAGARATAVVGGVPTLLTTTVLDSTRLTAVVPAALLTQAGTFLVNVSNPDPTVGVSNDVLLTVQNPLPVFTTLTPSTATVSLLNGGVYTGDVAIRLTGTGLIPASVLRVLSSSGATATATTLTGTASAGGTRFDASLPAVALTTAGTVRITVENPLPGGGIAAPQTLTLLNPAPVLTALAPVRVPFGQDTVLTLTGSNFLNVSSVLVNGTPLADSLITFPSATNDHRSLTVRIPASVLAQAATYGITVQNPTLLIGGAGLGGGTSLVRVLTAVNPVPTFTALQPATTLVRTTTLATITGTNFLPVSLVRLTRPTPAGTVIDTLRSPQIQVLNSTTITITLPDTLLAQRGTYSFAVLTPAPGGGLTAARTMSVRTPRPVLVSLTPAVMTATPRDTVLTLRGSAFLDSISVSLRLPAGHPMGTTFTLQPALNDRLGDSLLTLRLPAGVLGAAGSYSLTATNLAPSVGVSLPLTLVVQNPAPVLTAVTQDSILAGSPDQTLTLSGQFFVSGARVTFRNPLTVVTLATTFVDAQTLTVNLAASRLTTATTFTVSVQNPAPNDGFSNSVPWTITNPVPVLSLITRETAVVSTASVRFTADGTGFMPATASNQGSQVSMNGVPVRTVYRPATMSLPIQLWFYATAANLTTADTARITVLNARPGGGLSNMLTVQVQNPAPVLSAIAPTRTDVLRSTTLTLSGSRFLDGATVTMTDAAGAVFTTTTTLVSATRLTLHVPAQALTLAGTMSVVVENPFPAAAASTPRTLTVDYPRPVLTSLTPTTATLPLSETRLVMTGSGFYARTQLFVNNAASGITPQQDSTLSFTQATYLIPAGLWTTPGNVSLALENTSYTGTALRSTARTLVLRNDAARIDSLQPTVMTANAATQTLTVFGAGFLTGAVVRWNGVNLTTTYVSDTQVTAVVPAARLQDGTVATISVMNPSATAGSNVVRYIVGYPFPVLNTVSPPTIAAGQDTVLTLTGTHFLPISTVLFSIGTTATVLNPLRFDSTTSLSVLVPASLIHSRGTYSIRVVNPPLVLDSMRFGGGVSATRTITVTANPVASVEYIGVDTVLTAGDRMPFLTLRFRDRTENLVDVDPVLLSYTSVPDTTLPDSLRPPVITGTFPVTRLSLGTYRADTLRFTVPGSYRLAVDTAATGTLQERGARTFVVLARPAFRVDVAGLEPAIAAGDRQRFRVSFTDSFMNPTDNGIRPVLVTASLPTGTFRYVMGTTRISTGVYDMEVLRYTTSGTYTLSFTGIDTLNITGNRRFSVAPVTAASVQYIGVTPLLTAGTLQSRFRAVFRDSFLNLTDVLTPEQLAVQYSNSTSANVSAGDSLVAGTIPLSRLSTGNYQTALQERFVVAGLYSFMVQGIASTTGTARFRVQPAGDARVEFVGVRDTLIAGDSLRTITVRYFDASGNPTDNGIGAVMFTKRTAPVSVARLTTTRLAQGVYAVQSTLCTLTGLYDMTVVGISTTNTLGNYRSVVLPAPVVSADFVITTTAMTRTGARATITATYRDRFGNLADFDGALTLRNAEFASVTTVTMIRQRTGIYTGTTILFAPGEYTVSFGATQATITIGGTTSFALEPGPAVSADFQNVQPALQAGTPQSAFVMMMRDRRGSPTDIWGGELRFGGTGGGSTGVTGAIPTAFDYSSPALYGLLRATPTLFTTAGNYTLSLTGGITRYNGTRSFAVAVAPTDTVLVMTTPAQANIVAGTTLGVRLRFTDRFGNPVVFAAPAQMPGAVRLQQNGSTLAASTLAATAVRGEYAASFRPSTAGTYSLTLENLAGVPLTGTTAVTVLPMTDFRIELAGVQTQLTAGSAQAPFTITYRDRFGNLTDSTIGAVVVRNLANTRRDTLRVERLQAGRYRAEALTLTVADRYLVTVSGISAANITGDSAFTVVPAQAAQAVFQSVPAAITVGNTLPAFTVRYRDRFGNPVEFDAEVKITNILSPLVRSGITPLNEVIAPTVRTSLSVSTATLTKPFSIAGDYTCIIQGISPENMSGTTYFTVRPLAAATAEIVNVQERVPSGMAITPFSIIYRDRLGNVTDYGRDVTLTNINTPSLRLTIPMFREAAGVSTATTGVILSTVGTYRINISGMTAVSGITTMLVTSTSAVAQTHFWNVPQNTIAGTAIDSFYVAFLKTNGEYKDFDGIVRYQHTSGSPSGILTLTKLDTGIYRTNSLLLTKAGSYRLTVDKISVTTGTMTFTVVSDTTVVRSVVDSLVSAGILAETTPPFTVSHFDRFDNPVVNSPQAITFFVNNALGDTIPMLSSITPQGAFRSISQVFSSTGSYQLQTQQNRVWLGNRTIQIYPPKPVITSVSPQIFTVGSTAVVTILGKNFADDCTILFGGQLFNVERLESGRIKLYINKNLLTDSTRRDSLVVINEPASSWGQSNKWGATIAGSSNFTISPTKAVIDQPKSFQMRVTAPGSYKNAVYQIRLTNSAGVFRNFPAERTDSTFVVSISGTEDANILGGINQVNTVKEFRDLGSGTHTVSIIEGQNTVVAGPATQAFFIENPAPRITKLTATYSGQNRQEVSRTQPIDINNWGIPSRIPAPNAGWVLLKIHGSGLLRDTNSQYSVRVIPINRTDTALTSYIINIDSVYYGTQSNIEIRMYLGPNTIPLEIDRVEYKVVLQNNGFPNNTTVTAGGAPREGGGIAEFSFSIVDTGPVVVSCRPNSIRASIDTIRAINVHVRRFDGSYSSVFVIQPDGNFLPLILGSNQSRISDSVFQINSILTQKGYYSVKGSASSGSSYRSASFYVGEEYPNIISLSPSVITIGQVTEFTVQGRGFTERSRLTFDDGIEPMDIMSRTLSSNPQQLRLNIREALLTVGRHRLIVTNDTSFGCGGQDTVFLTVNSRTPNIDSLRPNVAMAGVSRNVIIYGRSLSSQTKILVRGFPNDTIAVAYSPARNTTPAIIAAQIPGDRIRVGVNNIYAVNPGGFISPETLTLLGQDDATFTRILRLEPSSIRPMNRDTIVRIIGRNFDAQTFPECFINQSYVRLNVRERIGDSIIIVDVPKEFINKKNNIVFHVMKSGDRSEGVNLSVDEILPRITALKTQYLVQQEPGFLFWGYREENTISNDIYAGTYLSDYSSTAFPNYRRREYQNTFVLEGTDLSRITALLIDGTYFPYYNYEGNELFDFGINYKNIQRDFSYGSVSIEAYKYARESIFLGKSTAFVKGISNNNLEFSRIYPSLIQRRIGSDYDYTVLFSSFLYGYFIDYNHSMAFILDTLSSGNHTVQVMVGTIPSNIFTFEVKERPKVYVERLELETSRSNYSSIPFSSLNFTIPTDTVKYIYVIAPKENAAFTKSSSVFLNNYSVPFEFIHHGLLRVKITPQFLYQGMNGLGVLNKAGFASPNSGQRFRATINLPQEQPRVTSIIPTVLSVGNSDTTITVRGTGLTPFVNVLLQYTDMTTSTDESGNVIPNAIVLFQDLPVTNVTSTSMTVTIPARFRNQVTIDTLIIGYTRWGMRSDTVFLPIRQGVTISSVQPNTLDADIQGEPIQRDTLTVRGRGFDATTRVSDTQSSRITLLQQADSLIRFIPPDAWYSVVGNRSITISNAINTGTTTITIQYPRPMLESITPNPILLPAGATVLPAQAPTAQTNDEQQPVAGMPRTNATLRLSGAPNPFDSQTTLEYTLSKDATLWLEVYDSFGRRVAELVPRTFHAAGTYSLPWNAERNIAAGVYTAVVHTVDAQGTVTRTTIRITCIR